MRLVKDVSGVDIGTQRKRLLAQLIVLAVGVLLMSLAGVGALLWFARVYSGPESDEIAILFIGAFFTFALLLALAYLALRDFCRTLWLNDESFGLMVRQFVVSVCLLVLFGFFAFKSITYDPSHPVTFGGLCGSLIFPAYFASRAVVAVCDMRRQYRVLYPRKLSGEELTEIDSGNLP